MSSSTSVHRAHARIQRVVLAVLLLLFPLLTAAPAQAATTFDVNRGYDENDHTHGDGVCDARPGEDGDQCTLRAAVDEANATEGLDTIVLPAESTTTLTQTGRGEDGNETGDLDITESVDVVGAGAGSSIVDADTIDRVFDIHGAIDVSFTDLTITNGLAEVDLLCFDQQPLAEATCESYQDEDAWGGGIRQLDGGTLGMTGVGLEDNQAFGSVLDLFSSFGSRAFGAGGGVAAVGTMVTATGVGFDFNSANDVGGGVFCDGCGATFDGGAFRDNTAAGSEISFIFFEPVGDGGGIASQGGGRVHVNGTAFERNSALGDGGAILTRDDGGEPEITAQAASGDLTVSGASFEDNEAHHGGAIHVDGTEAAIAGSTFTTNHAVDEQTEGPFGPPMTDPGYGGALYIGSQSGADVTSSTFTQNDATGDGGAISSSGWLQVESSVFDRNSSGAEGGGIYAGIESGAVTFVSDTSFVDNVAVLGGAFAQQSFDVAALWNVTMSGNEADTGGAVWNGGFLTASFTTVVDNEASAEGSGGGFYSAVPTMDDVAETATTRVAHVIVGRNAPDNCAGAPVESGGHNLTDEQGCPGMDLGGDDVQADDLGVAQQRTSDNPAGLPVNELYPDSPAIDIREPDSPEGAEECRAPALDGSVSVDADERGYPRPVDGDGSGTAYCDAGAVEFSPPEITLTPESAENDVGDEHTVTATLIDQLEAPAESITVRFDVTGANPNTGSGTTGEGGTTTHTWTGTTAGQDTITGWVDLDGDETRDEAEPTATATKTWVEDDPEVEDEITRLGGADRWRTAIEVSQHSYADGAAGAVVLARGDDFADALAGTPFAVSVDAPLLLTLPGQLIDDVAAEIERVLPAGGTVYLLGETDALSEGVEDQVEALGYEVVRHGGPDRYGTAVEIAQALGDPDTLMIASGIEFVDSLTAGPAAIAERGAILLTHPQVKPGPTETYLDDHGGGTVYAIGGPDANPYADTDDVDDSVYGGDRFLTAVAVAEAFFTAPDVVGIARSDLYPDSLTGGVHIGRLGGPMLVTPSTSLQDDIADHLCDASGTIDQAYVYGGSVAIAPTVATDVDDRINGVGC